VIGLDNHNDYYDINLKLARLARIQDHSAYTHIKADLADRMQWSNSLKTQPQRVVNLQHRPASGTP